MMAVIVLVPTAVLVFNERFAVLLLLFMVPYNGATLQVIPRIAQNAVLLGMPTLFLARVAMTFAAKRPMKFDVPREVLFYIGAMFLGVIVGYTHLDQINPIL